MVGVVKTKENVWTSCGERRISLDIRETDIYSNMSNLDADKLWQKKHLPVIFIFCV